MVTFASLPGATVSFSPIVALALPLATRKSRVISVNRN